MVKIFELQIQTDDISTTQSRIVEFEDFGEYLQNVNKSLPRNAHAYKKHVDFIHENISFHFDFELGGRLFSMIHYAEILNTKEV